MKPQPPSSKSLKTAYHHVSDSAGQASRARAAGGAGEVRIIGGKWKRRKLPVLAKPGLRPTPDRVRETLFNWLGQDLTGLRCLDAFAGSGALGFEAASRGAQDVLMIEQDAQLASHLQTQKTRLKADTIRIQRGDGIAMMRSLPKASLDVIFLDPPFDSDLFLESIQAAAGALSAQGAIYLEAPDRWDEERLAPLGLQVIKQGKAGAVSFHLFARSNPSLLVMPFSQSAVEVQTLARRG
jgi:16S rRNA (guanine966-N2)-methyltransferase